ncbi:Mut7-C RNAse domain-containing protein [Halobacterium zhouii]|uniref:Mut7-C RNAse domain-containing protein n=1 Tax=Halobacterium zhouii TaxID=2902624 RepID=UPI001E434699|nr:Mut7-C RNAse domain-containing protein [Halobacterium zhouii]
MRFLLDAMLGDLARILRMCGHDAAYCLDRDVEADDDVRALALDEGRVLLTRDEQLAARTPDSILVRSKDTDEQLRELRDAGVSLELAAGERCGACNGRLERVASDAPRPEYVPDDVSPVWRCRDCGQWFWQGSHWDDVRTRLRF